MKAILASIIVLLVGCVGVEPPTEKPKWVGKYGNACLPEAIAMAQGLREKGIKAKVLNINTYDFSHAVAVYMYPPGENKLWAWDSYWKSIRLRAYYNMPRGIARAWLKWTQHNPARLKSAWFHETDEMP